MRLRSFQASSSGPLEAVVRAIDVRLLLGQIGVLRHTESLEAPLRFVLCRNGHVGVLPWGGRFTLAARLPDFLGASGPAETAAAGPSKGPEAL